jgi:predicted 3-demethylubiquinone-9 3-methyltransferase (glyoxalase superfamily)
LMDAAFFRVPGIAESAGKLRGLGLAVMKAGDATVAQQRVLNDTIPIAEFQLHNMNDGLTKAYAYNSALSPKVDSKQTQEEAAAFFALARAVVVNWKDYAIETQSKYLELGN